MSENMAYSTTSGTSWGRFSEASNGWFAAPQVAPEQDDWADEAARPRVSWLWRAFLATFVTLVVFGAAAFLVYALAHGGGVHGELSRAALRAVGVPAPMLADPNLGR